jgi:hypothetical protein
MLTTVGLVMKLQTLEVGSAQGLVRKHLCSTIGGFFLWGSVLLIFVFFCVVFFVLLVLVLCYVHPMLPVSLIVHF